MVGIHDHEELTHIEMNIEEVLKKATPEGLTLHKKLLGQHPADIALLISHLKEKYQIPLLLSLPVNLIASVFEFLSHQLQATVITNIDAELATDILKKMPVI